MREPKSSPLFLSSLLLLFFSRFSLGDDSSILEGLSKAISPTPSGWKQAKPCDWAGITCDTSDQITAIRLSKMSLSGTLPTNLNQLKMLQSLFLQGNHFSGPLPSFANLSNLRVIDLDNNNFTSVPLLCFSGLSSLQELTIDGNQNLEPWFFPPELSQSEALVNLSASRVNLMGSLPDVFGKLSSLQFVRLSYNNLTGSLPMSFAGTGLQQLLLNNQALGLSGRLDVLGTLTQLSQVWLQVNAFIGPVPDLSNCTELSDLQLRDNQVTGVVPPSVTTLPRLSNVELQNNKLQGPQPEFGKGVIVKLGDTNQFCDTKPGPCDPQVTTLLEIAGAIGYPMNLAESWKGNDACEDWSFVSCDSERKVTGINFSKQHFVGTISPAFGKLTSLRNLLLNDNDLIGAIPDSLASLPQLQLLDVGYNNLTGKIPKFSSKVNLKTPGNLFLGTDVPVGGGTGSGARSSAGTSGNSSTPITNDTDSRIRAGNIAGIVIGSLVFITAVFLVSYICITKKHPKKFGRLRTKNVTSKDHNAVLLSDAKSFIIRFEVLRQATNNFDDKNILGKGGFGTVYKGVLHEGTQLAVKRMESTKTDTTEFQAEIYSLTNVKHKNLVTLRGYCIEGNERLLVYEYMSQGNLNQHLFGWKENGMAPLAWNQRLSIALDIAKGVEYLHTLNNDGRVYIHRDLKSSNILLSDDMTAKISDFGMAKITEDVNKSILTIHFGGTYGYIAPEILERGSVSTKADVYAFGAILMEIVTGRKALDEKQPEDRQILVRWFRKVITSVEDIRGYLDPILELDANGETYESIDKVIKLARHCTSSPHTERADIKEAVNVLGPLVKPLMPSKDTDDYKGIDFSMNLIECVESWRKEEGRSSTDSREQ